MNHNTLFWKDLQKTLQAVKNTIGMHNILCVFIIQEVI